MEVGFDADRNYIYILPAGRTFVDGEKSSTWSTCICFASTGAREIDITSSTGVSRVVTLAKCS